MIVLGIVLSLLSFALPIVIAVLVVRAVTRRRSGQVGDGQAVRRFFQYVLLYGLLVIAVTGVTDLVGQLMEPPTIVDGRGSLARPIAFVVVGVPVFGALGAWTRRRLRADDAERESLGWVAYLTVTALTAVVVGAVAVYSVVSAALVDADLDAPALVRLVVWGGVWAAHWLLGERTLDVTRRLPHLLAGSLIGWGTSLAGLVALVANTVEAFGVTNQDVLVDSSVKLGSAAAVLAAGVPVWVAYWLLRLSRAPASPLWLGYVLVAGVGVSLAMTLTGISIVLYRMLVLVFGDPPADGASTVPVSLAVALVGALSWWYHREVLGQRVEQERTEVTRIYEYLLSAAALTAAAAGVALVVVALIEAITPVTGELVSSSVLNAVLAAVTLLAVGVPLWWVFWRRIERATAADAATEVPSPSRRIYLFVLFGLAGVVAIVVVLVAAFLAIEDLLEGQLGWATLRDVQVPVGLLVAAGATSGYHWLVYREDRRLAPPAPPRAGPREILLVGPRDETLLDHVRRATGVRADLWVAAGPPWVVPQVLAILAAASHEQVLVVSGPQGPWPLEAGRPVVLPRPVSDRVGTDEGAASVGHGVVPDADEAPGQRSEA